MSVTRKLVDEYEAKQPKGSTQKRPDHPEKSVFETLVDVSSEDAFVESLFMTLNSVALKEWVRGQGDYHVRMDLDLLSPRDGSPTLKVFSVDASMLIHDKAWESVRCAVINTYLRADRCTDGSENKLFYKHALSLKQFILHDLPDEERKEVLRHAHRLFVAREPATGFSNIQTFSGIPFFHLKPFATQ
jgi:hypothetical protein